VEYIRLITSLSEHRKWLATSDRGHTVLIALWCYCGRMETDGYVPGPVGRREGLSAKLAAELEELGWLHRNGEGWHVHDWEEHQIPKERLAERRRITRERVRKWRAEHGS
jgi:hypothetical protein